MAVIDRRQPRKALVHGMDNRQAISTAGGQKQIGAAVGDRPGTVRLQKRETGGPILIRPVRPDRHGRIDRPEAFQPNRQPGIAPQRRHSAAVILFLHLFGERGGEDDALAIEEVQKARRIPVKQRFVAQVRQQGCDTLQVLGGIDQKLGPGLGQCCVVAGGPVVKRRGGRFGAGIPPGIRTKGDRVGSGVQSGPPRGRTGKGRRGVQVTQGLLGRPGCARKGSIAVQRPGGQRPKLDPSGADNKRALVQHHGPAGQPHIRVGTRQLEQCRHQNDVDQRRREIGQRQFRSRGEGGNVAIGCDP